MKRYLLWAFERGSTQYDVICAVIVAFIFLTPATVFDDRPDFMRLQGNDPVRRARDDNGKPVYTVKVDMPLFASEDAWRQSAEERLNQAVDAPFTVSKAVPIIDAIGRTRAYAFWIER
jgi:hypothetical protein